VESAAAAQEGGAKRVELCANLLEGGVTPSSGTIQLTRRQITIPIHVLIRPRGGDFCYSSTEFEVMKLNIDHAKTLGADGIVSGILKPDGTIDRERNRALIEIISLAELATRERAWQRNVYELEMILSQDVPMPTTFVPPPFEQYAKSEFEDPGFLPQAWLVALDGDAMIGMANLFKSTDTIELLETGLTGVLRDYRRRGLATALKSQVIELAQGLGARQIHTWNEENNPMFQLNLRLGFKPQPADLDWQKETPFDKSD
jgi:GNAT superfamily N-acetyltransferase